MGNAEWAKQRIVPGPITNEDEAVTNAAEQELHAQRYAIQAYLHRTHQPLELGV